MPETETIVTEYGEVEAETEECHNCGDKVLAEQTLDVVMGKRIRSWGSGTAGGSDYPAHRAVVGLEDKRNPESQIWCLECAEYELGYAIPAGREGRSFPNRREQARSILADPRFSAALSIVTIILLGLLLL